MIAGLKLIDGEEIKVSVTGNSNIVQSNYMISHKEHWTVAEERLFTTILAMMDVGDKRLHLYKIPISTFVDLWGVDKEHVYTEVKAVLKSLQQKGIYNREHSFDRTPALTRAIYDDGKDYVLVQIHPDLQEHLIDIKVRGGYTRYKLENSLRLNRAKAGANANRLYEICRSYARKGKTVEKTLTIEELRQVLSLGDKYKQLRDLEKRVLSPCVQKINENTDLCVFYVISGRGKKATITFSVSLVKRDKLPEDVPAVEPEPEELPEVPEDIYLLLGDGDDVADIYREGVEAVHNELRKLPAEFSYDEAELAYKYALQNGCDGFVEISDYASINVQYCRIRWKSIKQSKNGYVLSAFCENFAKWSPNR